MEEKTKNILKYLGIGILIILWIAFIKNLLSVGNIFLNILIGSIINVPFITLILYLSKKEKNGFPLGYNIILAIILWIAMNVLDNVIWWIFISIAKSLGNENFYRMGIVPVNILINIFYIILLCIGIYISRKKEINYNYMGNTNKNYTGLKVISFFIPIVGLIVYAVNIVQNPEIAKECGKYALIGFCIGLILSVIGIMIVFA